ncbi:MAG: hypothetical protein R2867_19045 [Caldilineaceae bacterium]
MVAAGSSRDIVGDIDMAAATGTLYATLSAEESDAPGMVDSKLVRQRFMVRDLTLADD